MSKTSVLLPIVLARAAVTECTTLVESKALSLKSSQDVQLGRDQETHAWRSELRP